MEETKLAEIMDLKNKSLEDLKAKYQEVFGQEPPSNNKVFLWRKIAYRLQEMEYGGLSKETQTRINNLIDRYDPINNKMFRPQKSPGKVKNKERDTRLPMPGAIIRKTYKGQLLEVKVLEKGFEYQNQHYKTLSAVAKAITGIHWNGYLFFRP
jgi:hypothetical protein